MSLSKSPSCIGHEDKVLPIENLDRRDRALATLSIVAARGDEDLVKEQVTAALEAGATDDEVTSIYDNVIRVLGDSDASRISDTISETLSAARDYKLMSTRIVQLADHTTLVRDTGGPGIPIILLHALSLDSSMYRDIYPTLQRTARVIAYDIRGFGQAQNAPLVKDFAQLANDLAVLFDRLSIDVADVYGTSYGGAIAQQFAVQHPTRVRSVAILASIAKGFPIIQKRATDAEEHGIEHMVPLTLMRWFLPESIASNTWPVRFARMCIRRVKLEQWAAAWRAMATFDIEARLEGIKVPVLAVGGKQDTSTPPNLVQNITDRIPGAQYVEIDPGTHMMVMEQGLKLAEVLQQFRKDVDSKV